MNKKLTVFFVFLSCYTLAQADTHHVDIVQDKECPADTLQSALMCGEFSGRLKTLYFSTHHAYFVENLNQDTIAVGGFLKYQTQPFSGVTATLSYAGQRRLDNRSNNTAEVSELSQHKDGLAEAYLQWENQKTRVKLGQQPLDLPFLGNYDWRIMPVLYRAADFEYRLEKDFIRLTAVDRFKSYADDEFTKTSRYSDEQKTDGMWSIGIGKSLELDNSKQIKGEAWYQQYQDYTHLAYLEGHVVFENIIYQPDIGFQMMYGKPQGKAYAGDTYHIGFGLYLGIKLQDQLSLKSGYNYIQDKRHAYINGALFAPYMIYTASGPYFAQPFFTSTQDLGAGHAMSVTLEGTYQQNTYWGLHYSFMHLREIADVKSLNQSEYVIYGIHNFSGALKNWSISNFAGVMTSPRSDKIFLQNRLGLTYQF